MEATTTRIFARMVACIPNYPYLCFVCYWCVERRPPRRPLPTGISTTETLLRRPLPTEITASLIVAYFGAVNLFIFHRF